VTEVSDDNTGAGPKAQLHTMPEGTRIAFIQDGEPPAADQACGTFWLGGFKSDMRGTKAEVLADHAQAHKPVVRALRLFRPR
jgi:hypothetical protein